MNFVGLAEYGRVPDPVLRWGMRRLLAARLRQEGRRHGADADAAVDAFAERLRTAPVAVDTEAANAQHYEVPSAFFEAILGPRLKYSSCLFEDARSSLAEAEEAMLRLTAERAGLADGQRVLELGCGWGSFCLWAAERFPASRITAVSNSRTQREFIEAQAIRRGLANLQVVTADANIFDPGQVFDRIVSVEMFEHLRNVPEMFDRAATWLAPGGTLFLHVFCHRRYAYLFQDEGSPADWMARYFFTGGMMPAEDLYTRFDSALVREEVWSVPGTHYARTLDAWLARLDARRGEIERMFAATYGATEAAVWVQRWRMFLMACSELFGWNGGHTWYVTHQRFRRKLDRPAVSVTPSPEVAPGSQVAVIGSGVAGLTAAWLLRGRHRVTLFERNAYLGGHTHTAEIPHGPDAGTCVDTGFIVLNDRTYPLMNRLLDRLGVARQPSDMSFSYSEPHGLEYGGASLRQLFAQPANLVRPAFLGMVADIARFFRRGARALADGEARHQTLGEWLDLHRFGPAFREQHLLPMAAAIWSAPPGQILEFPAETFLRFYANHGLLAVRNRPQWLTVTGGAHTYVKAMARDLADAVHTSSPAMEIRRDGTGVEVRTAETTSRFDAVVLASHADESLAMLADPTEAERRALGAWTYSRNRAVLHQDVSLMPRLRTVWSSWNVLRDGRDPGAPVCLTYWMNLLQSLRTRHPVLVTLNPVREPDPSLVLGEFEYTHPQYNRPALTAQSELASLQGAGRTWYCGAYHGYGFHEDGVRSGADVAARLGGEIL